LISASMAVLIYVPARGLRRKDLAAVGRYVHMYVHTMYCTYPSCPMRHNHNLDRGPNRLPFQRDINSTSCDNIVPFLSNSFVYSAAPFSTMKIGIDQSYYSISAIDLFSSHHLQPHLTRHGLCNDKVLESTEAHTPQCPTLARHILFRCVARPQGVEDL